jgi:hypothetical protein
MRRGDLLGAWAIGDRILANNTQNGPRWDVPRHVQWIWDGRPLTGRVLVRCYHGLGDTIQFARFLPQLDDAIVWAQPALLPLLGKLPKKFAMLALHDGTPEVDYDVDIEMMELAHALRVTPETLAANVPYFDVSPAPRMSDKFSVGIVAAAGDWDTTRSIPVALLDSLREINNVQLFNLQLESPVSGLIDVSTPDVLTLASRVRALDLVVSVDTMVAHLSGALGVPTWTLLSARADWRWMEQRDDSPWYPSMRLFRQRSPGAWGAVVDRVRAALSERAQ